MTDGKQDEDECKKKSKVLCMIDYLKSKLQGIKLNTETKLQAINLQWNKILKQLQKYQVDYDFNESIKIELINAGINPYTRLSP